jgi:hypothetical protein
MVADGSPEFVERTAQLSLARNWHQMEPPPEHVRTTDTSPGTPGKYTMRNEGEA